MARIIQKDKTIQNVFRLEQVVLELGQLFERSWDLWIFAYWAWKQVTLWMVVRYVWDQHMVVWSEKASDHVLHISLALPSKIWDPDRAIQPSYHIHHIISSFLPWLSPLFCLSLMKMLIFIICLCFFICWSKAMAEIPIPVPLMTSKPWKDGLWSIVELNSKLMFVRLWEFQSTEHLPTG